MTAWAAHACSVDEAGWQRARQADVSFREDMVRSPLKYLRGLYRILSNEFCIFVVAKNIILL